MYICVCACYIQMKDSARRELKKGRKTLMTHAQTNADGESSLMKLNLEGKYLLVLPRRGWRTHRHPDGERETGHFR